MIGMTSVTFRKKGIDEIIALCKAANLDCIEWGGDIHVPAGDFETAQAVRRKTEQANLKINSYGSYFRVGQHTLAEFASVLKTASILGAPLVRVWCGEKGSAHTADETLLQYTDTLKSMCQLAKEYQITVACEYHKYTYNDSPATAAKLLEKVNEPNYKTYWQTIDYNEDDWHALTALQNHIATAHIFTWDKDATRYPLSKEAPMWRQYIKILKQANIPCILEFVKDDDAGQFMEDAEFLREFVKSKPPVNWWFARTL